MICLPGLNPQIYCLPTISYILGQMLKTTQCPPVTWTPWLCPHSWYIFPWILWLLWPYLTLWTECIDYGPLRSLLQLGPVFSLWPAFFPIPTAHVARIPELSHGILVISWAEPYWSYLEAWLVHFRSKGTVWFIFRACGSNPWNAPVLENGCPDCKTQ